jgi:hypothetical protein
MALSGVLAVKNTRLRRLPGANTDAGGVSKSESLDISTCGTFLMWPTENKHHSLDCHRIYNTPSSANMKSTLLVPKAVRALNTRKISTLHGRITSRTVGMTAFRGICWFHCGV